MSQVRMYYRTGSRILSMYSQLYKYPFNDHFLQRYKNKLKDEQKKGFSRYWSQV